MYDKVITEMAAENKPKNHLAVDKSAKKGEDAAAVAAEGQREWSPTPAPRTRRQRSPRPPTPLLAYKAGSLHCLLTMRSFMITRSVGFSDA